MTDLTYDPELPFVVAYSSGDRPLARFRHNSDADRFRSHFMSEGVIVDTTPKPKIPEDARFLHWFADRGNYVAVWENFNESKPWELESSYYSESELLDEIGDAEVTVLVRKEES